VPHHNDGKTMKIFVTVVMVLLGILGLFMSMCGIMVGGRSGYLAGLSGIMYTLAGHCFVGLAAMSAWRKIPTWRVRVERGVFVLSGLALAPSAWVNSSLPPFGNRDGDLSMPFIVGAVLLLLVALVLLGLRVNHYNGIDTK
jgi:hypothetical protein